MTTPDEIWPPLPIAEVTDQRLLLGVMDLIQGQIASVEERMRLAREVLRALAPYAGDGNEQRARVEGLIDICEVIVTRLRTDRDRVNERLAELRR